jgi:hypothetical protein
MHSILIFIVVFVLAYCVCCRRRIDLLTVAVGATVAYYTPIIIGQIDFRHHNGVITPDDRAMGAVAGLLLLLLFTLIIRDLLGLAGLRERSTYWDRSKGVALSVVLSVLVILAFSRTPWSSLMSPDKHNLMEHSSGVFRSLAALAAGMLPILVATTRRWIPTALALLPALILLYLGFRFPLVWGVCGIVLMVGAGRLRGPVLMSRRGLMLVAAGLFLFLGVMTYKHVYMAIKTADSVKIAAAIDRLSTNPERVMLISEPQSISIMVDRTITEDFRLPSGHMTDAIVSMFTPGSGWRYRNFNARFQSRFYPDRRGGMGNSPLAEVWAWGHAPAVAIAAVAWCGLLLVLTLLFSSSRDGFARAAMTLVGLLWAVNVHRNDLRYTIVLSIAVLVLWALTTLVAALWRVASKYKRAWTYAGATECGQ